MPLPIKKIEENILYWDISIVTDRVIRHNRPGNLLVEKKMENNHGHSSPIAAQLKARKNN